MLKRVYAFFIALAAFTAIFQLGSMSTVDPNEAQELLDTFEEIVETIDAAGIFLHNTSIALPMFIPGFGAIWGAFSAWSTGYVFAAIATVTPAIAETSPLSILFLTPFGLMEITAYSIAVSRSGILAFYLVRKNITRTHLLHTVIEIGIVAGLLALGGLVEFWMIELLKEGAIDVPGI